MKKTISVKAYYLPAILLCAGALLYASTPLKKGLADGLHICGETLIPSVFPFLVLCSLAVMYVRQTGGIFARLFGVVFHLPGCCAGVVLLSLLGGYPTGPMMCAALYENGQITAEQAKRMSLFCCCSGPAFSLVAVGEGMCANRSIGILLLCSCTAAQLLFGIVLGLIARKKGECKSEGLYNTPPAFSAALPRAVENSIDAMLHMCAYVLLFSGLLALLERCALPAAMHKGLCALLEVTLACNTFHTQPPLLAFALGFGGLSVFFQIKKYLFQTGTSSLLFLAARLLCGGISYGCYRLLAVLFPPNVPTLAGGISLKAFSYSAPLSAALLLSFAVFIVEQTGVIATHHMQTHFSPSTSISE